MTLDRPPGLTSSKVASIETSLFMSLLFWKMMVGIRGAGLRSLETAARIYSMGPILRSIWEVGPLWRGEFFEAFGEAGL